MRKASRGPTRNTSSWALLLGVTVASALGCRAEAFRGGLGAGAAPEPAGAGGGGGAGAGGGATAAPAGTAGDIGGAGSGVAGGDGDGAASIGAGGGAQMDAAPDLAPTSDANAAPDGGTEDAPSDGGVSSPDAAPDAGACVKGIKDFSNIGTGNFHVSFRVATTQTGWVALVNQRSTCYFGVFWDIRLCGAGGPCPQGAIYIETDDKTSAGATYQSVHSAAVVNDGKAHDVAVARVSGVIAIQIDGAPSGTGPSSASLGAMPALRIGTDVCDGPGNSPSTAAFAGMMLSDVCLTSP